MGAFRSFFFATSLCAVLYFWISRKNPSDAQLEIIYNKAVSELVRVNGPQSHISMDSIEMVPIPQNHLFKRSKAVQSLFDYANASVRQNATNANYVVACNRDFTLGTALLPETIDAYTIAVEIFVDRFGLYSQTAMSAFATREVVTEENAQGVSGLIGQFGMFATMDIAGYTAVGQYFGDEYTDVELDIKLPFKDNPQKWRYMMKRFVSEMAMSAELPQDLIQGMTIATDAYFDPRTFPNKITLEPFVNDARSNIKDTTMSEHDANRKNIEYVSCTVDDMPMTFLVSTQEIQKEQQLLVFYGQGY